MVSVAVNERFFSSPYCPCIDRKYCPWFKQSLQEVHRSRNTALKTQFTLMMRGLICDRRKRHIKCCTSNSVNSIINSLTTAKPTTTTPKSVNSTSSRLISQNIQVSLKKLRKFDMICWSLHRLTEFWGLETFWKKNWMWNKTIHWKHCWWSWR